MDLTIDMEKMRPSGFHNYVKKRRDDLIDRVNKGSDWTPVKECPVCKNMSNNQKYFDYRGIVSFVCDKCDCLYDDKVPVSVEDVYDNVDYLEHTKKTSYIKEYEYRKNRFGFERANIIESSLGSLKGKRILDIGCGTGLFLDVMTKFGAVPDGLEISKPLAEYTAKRLGIKVFTEDFMGFSSDYRYDVITMFDLIEHIKNPLDMLQRAKELLNKGGIILVFTPNYRSIAFEILKNNSNLYIPTDHLLFFSKKTVDFLAKTLGMELSMYSTNGMDAFDLLSFDRDINNIDISNSILLNNINKVQDTINISGYANHMRFILKKV
ncbi:MAG: class I SAM-dependent methyltransferase [Candidatus Aenigmarchaeota archaeon]|nr:class I SAM-dependent methyltransferase [Candidatus Aenigmarchaeota archaeon]